LYQKAAPSPMQRRQFLQRLAVSALGACVSCRHPAAGPAAGTARPRRILFVSQGRTGLIHADGTGLRYFDFKVPNQATWQPGPFFPDGRRAIFLSMEPRRDGPGRPFQEFYTQTPTHLWIYDLEDDSLRE